MSIWIFDPKRIKTIVILTAATGLIACGGGRHSSGTSEAQKSTISVGGKDLILKGPPGFCIDKSLSQFDDQTAFVLLGSCKVITPGVFATGPRIKALLTASVSANDQTAVAVADSTSAMDSFFRSENGRTALSRTSDPASVSILDSFENDGAYFLRASDTSPGLVPDAADDYWRSYFDLNGQIISVSVIGFKTQPIAAATGLDTVVEFTRLIRAENGVAVDPKPIETQKPAETFQPQQTTTPQQTTPRPEPSLRGIGILRRIFG